MAKKLILSIILFLFLNIFLIHSALALTANSSSYSVGMLGTSYQASSTSGNSTQTKLYLTTQTVGNAQSSSYQASIGYFGEYGAPRRAETGFYSVITSTKNITGGQTYSATIEIRNSSSNYIIPSSAPKIRLYDSLRNIIVDNVDATQISTGVYQYNFTTSITHTTGLYETLVSISVDGNSKQYRDFWRLVNAPTEVSILSITDNTIPTITANVIITNEGNIDYEYQYEYCIVSKESNQCGGGDDVDYGAGSKFISKSQSWNTLLTLNANQAGNYWFKVIVHYNSQISGASKSFTAITQPSAGGGTGGGGGGSSGDSNQPTTIDVQESAAVSEQQIINGIIAQLEINEKIILNFKPSNAISIGTHTITMSSIGTNSITLVISSNPITLQLSTGEEKEVDIDGDGMKDIYFKLNKINNGKVDLVIKKLTGKSLITGETIKQKEQLLDVLIRVLDDYKTVVQDSKILVEVTFYNFGTEEIKDAIIKYCIKTESGETIKCAEETVAVYTKIQLIKEFLISHDMQDGRYYVSAEVTYGNEKASSETTFLVQKEIHGVLPEIKFNRWLLIIIIIIIIFLIIMTLIIRIYAKKNRPSNQKFSGIRLKIKLRQLDELKSIGVLSKKTYLKERTNLLAKFGEAIINNKKVFVYFISALFVIIALTLTYKTNITGMAINNVFSRSNGSLLILLVSLSIFIILILLRKKLVLVYGKIIGHKKYPSNSIKGLINKKVYSESGHYIGKIKDIILEENKISSLKIEIDKKHKFKAKGIVIDYKHVKSVGEIVIIDKDILENVNSLKD